MKSSHLPCHTLSIAPMMDWTDRHCRYFHRLITPHSLLYTEMVTTGALIHGDHHRFLHYNLEEHPLALQLGGSNPRELALCARMAEDYGYDEVNLNVGCPSDRVQNGRFGACLMLEPHLVAECVAAMRQATDVPVTVKTRIGVDDHDSYDGLAQFVDVIARAGCRTFIIHARKAWLQGLSPKENREIPPLSYQTVHRIKADFPELTVIINGGLCRVEDMLGQLELVDGVMIGREAYHNPYMLTEAESLIFGSENIKSRHEIIARLMPYIEKQLDAGVRLHSITRHILGLFHGQIGARAWRRHLSENGAKAEAGIKVVQDALAFTL